MPSARKDSASPVQRNAVVALAIGLARGARGRGAPSACSTCRASAAPEVTIVDAAAQHPLEHRADERVVRAAEDHRVDVRLAQRRGSSRARLDEPARRTGTRPG